MTAINLTETCYRADWHLATAIDLLVEQGLARDDAAAYASYAFAERADGSADVADHLTEVQAARLELGELPRERRLALLNREHSSSAWMIRGESYYWTTDAASGYLHCATVEDCYERLCAEREWCDGDERSGAWLLIRGSESGEELQIGIVP